MKALWAASSAIVLAWACASKPEAAPAQTAAAEKPAGEKKICESRTPVGSITPKTECHTPEEWAAIRGKQSEAVRDAGRSVQSNANTFRTSP